MKNIFDTRSTARGLTVLCSALFMVAGAHAAGDKTAYDQAKNSAKATYDTAKKQCDSLAGNSKDICQAEAKGERKKAEANAEATYKGTPRAHYKARTTAADADYEVAKEKCDDKGGNDKDVCVKEAKAMLTKAKADAKAERSVKTVNVDTSKEKREADYKVAKEKCDALAGDAKNGCVNDAKVKYGM
jgi:hypothetical protein